jgi:hypothetical protein
MPKVTLLSRKCVFSFAVFGFTLLGSLFELRAQWNDPITAQQLGYWLSRAPVWGIRGYKTFPTQIAKSDTTTFRTADLDTLFWGAGMDSVKRSQLLSINRLRTVKSAEDWSLQASNRADYHFDAPYFAYVLGADTTWVASAHKMAIPGSVKYKNSAIQSTPPVPPSHFAPKPGWSWVYVFSHNWRNHFFSGYTTDTLWLTLKTYSESQAEFNSTWMVNYKSNGGGSRLINGKDTGYFVNEVWADTQFTLRGLIDSGMRFDDFLPQAFKTRSFLPPLFLNPCKLPALIVEKPFSLISSTFKPPYHYYWQLSDPSMISGLYKDSVGLVSVLSTVAPGVVNAVYLGLVYFGMNPPEKPVPIGFGAAQGSRKHRTYPGKAEAVSREENRGAKRVYRVQQSDEVIDGLGRLVH